MLRSFATIVADHANVQAELDRLIRVKFDVHPRLLLLGEEVALHLEARADATPNPRLEICEDCCRAGPNVRACTLDWHEGPAKGVFTAEWKWKPQRCGNYLLRWNCDIGGDVSTFSRNVGVVDNTYAVAILNSTSHIKPRPELDFHELHSRSAAGGSRVCVPAMRRPKRLPARADFRGSSATTRTC